MNEAVIAGLAGITLALAAPLLLAALGEIIVEKSGVINVGIEGMMLSAALAAYATAQFTHSVLLAVAAAISAGMALAGIFSLAALVFQADQVVVGTGVNILALGLTGVLYRALMAARPDTATVVSLPQVCIPYLDQLPTVGHVLFVQNAMVFVAALSVPLTSLFLNRTRAGLRLRACGENPAAADVAGVSVGRTRLAALLAGGFMAGLAGSYLSIGYTVAFAQNMTGGKGFIALAVVIVGRWSPVGALLAALCFGFANALQFQFQATNAHVPYQIFLALPYGATLLALSFNAGRTVAPALLGIHYRRA